MEHLKGALLFLIIPLLAACGAQSLRLREVVLYQNGIGYFEREGSVSGGFALRLAEHEVDDVIKTLTVVGADGSATLAAVIPNDPPEPIRATDSESGEELPPPPRRTTELEVSVGDAQQDVRVSYAVPTPSWSAVYRVVLPEQGEEALLQAWAVVHNASGEDWENVNLTLATGSPFTYAVDLRTPRFVARPDASGNFVTPVLRGTVGSTQSRDDGDNVAAEQDRCPLEPEDVDGFQDEDGCPDPDNDGDRILDVDDMCPGDPETYNGIEDEDGCPDRGRVVVSESRIVILDKIYFTNGSSRIQSRSLPIVDAVAATLVGNSGIHVAIEGHAHTGERGAGSLARRRAEVVRDALVSRGVTGARLSVTSHGSSQPMGDAERNRRVSFNVTRNDESSADATRAGAARAPSRPARPSAAPAVRSAPGISVASLSRRPSAGALSSGQSDETRYALHAPVTVPAESSTLVAIVNERVPGQEILLFRPDPNAPASRTAPFRAARLQNQSGLQLVRGPVALFARGTFVGEGVISTLNAGESTFIPFAIDASTRVSAVPESHREPHRITSIVRGVMTVSEWDIRTTRYDIRAGERTPSRLVIHHARTPGYELIDAPTGTEESGGAVVVPIDITAGGNAELTLVERRARPGRHALLHGSVDALEVYFSGEHLPAELQAQLAELLTLRQDVARMDDELRDIRAQQSIQGRRLSELQGSLGAIERSTGAAQLRRDLQQRLREATAASEALTVREAALAAERAEANVRLTEAVAAVSMEAEEP
ncbi:MAG: OmpA family protein [Polyangiales bacterium]